MPTLSANEKKVVYLIDIFLKFAYSKNCNVCKIMSTLVGNHLFSDGTSDKCHMDGVEFAEQINELGTQIFK